MTVRKWFTRIFKGAVVPDEVAVERAAMEVASRLEAVTTRLEDAVGELYSALGQVENE